MAWEYYGERLTDVLPAIGTHCRHDRRRDHRDVRQDAEGAFPRSTTGGTTSRPWAWCPRISCREISEGRWTISWPAQVDTLLVHGGHDLILSIGQVVPHEVIGMANYNKNIFVGTGGREGINKSHSSAPSTAMERIMGGKDNPVRRFSTTRRSTSRGTCPIVYVLTVV